MSSATVIDADGHVIESGEELARYGWSGSTTGLIGMDGLLARTPDALGRAVCPGVRPFTAESRLADMDREGIAVSVNYPTALLMLNQVGSPQLLIQLAAAYNSWAHDVFTAPSGGRVLTMALVGIADPDAAVTEARRAIAELGAPGIVVPPYAGTRHLDDRALDPLWALAEELDVAVGIHGGRGTTDPILPASGFSDQKRYYAIAHPFGQMVAMGDLVIGGVLARFPRLRVAFLEAGIGWVRWYVDRLDTAAESVDNGPSGWATLDRLPSEFVFGGNCFFSCEPDEPELRDSVAAVGEDLVVFSSDYPHFDCSFPESTTAIATHLPDPEVLRKVTLDNPRRLYGSRIG